ncbi:MAG: methylated-DNA--[protein]-cysteine S-methyltransferase [Archaeoglobaceae archaeon]
MFSVKFRDYYFNVELRGGKVVRTFFSRTRAFSGSGGELEEQLKKYFSGEKVRFDCEVELNVSAFARKVLERVAEIPYGEVVTYGELARELRTSPRAVGSALRANPTPVLIPCHRVVARNGLGGYSCGVEIKKMLLELEGLL